MSKSSMIANNGTRKRTNDCRGSSLPISALTLTSRSYADNSNHSGLHRSLGQQGGTNGIRRGYLPQRSQLDSCMRGPPSQSPLNNPTNVDPGAPPLGDPPQSLSDHLLKPVCDQIFSKQLSWTKGNALRVDLDISRNSKHGSGQNKHNPNNNNNDNRNDTIHSTIGGYVGWQA